MCKFLFSVSMGIWVGVADVPAKADGAKKADRPAIGFIHDRFVFAVDKGTKGRGKNGLIPSTIFRTPLITAVKYRHAPERYNYWDKIAYEAPYRWRIAHSCFWGTGGTVDKYGCELRRAPLDELRLMNPRTEELKALLRKKYPELIGTWLFMFQWDLGPIHEIWMRSGGRFGGLGHPPLDPPMYFDFLPVGKTTVLHFVVGRGKKMQVWEETATYSKEEGWETKYKNRKELHMKADFVEPFFVYQAESAYYFVTVSGKLYVGKPIADSLKPKKDEGKVVPLWTDAKRPICAVITDTASKKTFVFTEPARTDSNKEDYRYFELAEKITPKPYEAKPVSDSIAPPPLRQVLPYAHFLLAEKRIK